AEDGIRDDLVTGVQTCALPICVLESLAERVERHARLPIADLSQRELQCALPAEVLDTHAFDLVAGRRCRNGGERFRLETLHVHRSEEHTSELQSPHHLVCTPLL